LISCSDNSLYFTTNPVSSPRHILRMIFCSFPLISTICTCLCVCQKVTTNCRVPNVLYLNKSVTVSEVKETEYAESFPARSCYNSSSTVTSQQYFINKSNYRTQKVGILCPYGERASSNSNLAWSHFEVVTVLL
jgi:hypothetical protein